MFWVHCGLFVLVIAVPGFISSADSTSKRVNQHVEQIPQQPPHLEPNIQHLHSEHTPDNQHVEQIPQQPPHLEPNMQHLGHPPPQADYTLDDSFWNEETPAGEVEKLLREYRQNQELVRNIGSHYYQIIYPVQLRHHEKMGISTREAGFPKRSGYGDGGYQNARGRSRAGKHFHRTSLLIKAFNHKFRLDLELNTQLLAPNLNQKDFLGSGAEQLTKQEIEHCYYHGTVRDYPGASAAFHTCNGVSGVIHLGNETFVIQPFYGGDLSRHPHVIFEARTKSNKGCANTVTLEHRMTKNRRQKHVLGLSESTADRYKRDVREATKYIETAIVIDKAMFDKRNGSSRAEVVHDAIQVANIADLYFRTLNTRVSVVYVETWFGGNQAQIDSSMEIRKALTNFNDYTKRNMYHVTADTTQLLTGETFQGGESGLATQATVCSATSVGVSVDVNTYEPHLLAGTMAHMIGHNIGMGHDDGRDGCFCRDWHGCIMAKSIVGLENVQPYKFSECSKSDYEDALKAGSGICLLNKPNELKLRSCGNRVIDDGEQCDCGAIEECPDLDPCCDPITCKLKSESQCASGPCCSDCKLRARGHVCRESMNECDLPEVCSGDTGQCPSDVYKKNGTPCSKDASYCFNGFCPSLDLQCEQVWGEGGVAADKQCFEQFNSKGSINGHCGTDTSGHYVKCEAENVRCGSLQCQLGNKQPVIGRMDQPYLRTFISIKGKEYECKATTGKVEGSEMPGMGLVRDGTSCGDNLICYNQTCTSLFPHISPEKCPSNRNNNECSGNGACTNVNKCYCSPGWSGPDCSIEQDIPTLKPTSSTTEKPGKSTTETKLQKKETPYEATKTSLSTAAMVLILLAVVKGVFISFALMALCNRRKSTIQKYDPPYIKKPPPKTYNATPGNHHPEVAALDNVNKILTFGPMPSSYSCSETQRVLFQPQNNVGNVDGARLKEHKPQMMKRLGVDDEDGGTGAEEAVSFIDLPPNSLAKLPEKGILKKPGGYGLGDGTMVEMQRKLNSLNGFHGGIMEALRTAESHRGMSSTPSGSGNLIDDEVLRKSLADCGYADAYRKLQQQQQSAQQQQDGQDNIDNQDDEDEEDVPPSCGPMRIRTLEDIIRQLEHHSTRHMSPSGSEDMRISEGEGDRHYRIDSSVCSESSQGSRRCSRARDDDRFVYGRYRQPSARSPYGTHQHTHQHSHQMHEEEGIYETADPDRGSNTRGETPDSESDEFIQAQRQIARWTSEARDGAGGSGEGQSLRSESGIQHRPPQQPPPPQRQKIQEPLCAPLHQQLRVPLTLEEEKNMPKLINFISSNVSMSEKAAILSTMGHKIIKQLKEQRDKMKQQKLPVKKLPINEFGYYPSMPKKITDENGLDDDDYYYNNDDIIIDVNSNDDNDDNEDSNDKNNINVVYDDENNDEAVNAQSHQDIKLLNNNDKMRDAIKMKKITRNPDENYDDDDDDDDFKTTITTMRGIDVTHLPNINKCPLDDKYSPECNILISTGDDDDDDDDDDENSKIATMMKNNDDDGQNENDELGKNNTSNNTSDNENTALLPPSHFPEYKH